MLCGIALRPYDVDVVLLCCGEDRVLLYCMCVCLVFLSRHDAIYCERGLICGTCDVEGDVFVLWPGFVVSCLCYIGLICVLLNYTHVWSGSVGRLGGSLLPSPC